MYTRRRARLAGGSRWRRWLRASPVSSSRGGKVDAEGCRGFASCGRPQRLCM